MLLENSSLLISFMKYLLKHIPVMTAIPQHSKNSKGKELSLSGYLQLPLVILTSFWFALIIALLLLWDL